VLVPVFTNRGNGIVPVGILALALLLFTLLAPRWIRNGERRDAELAAEQAAQSASDEVELSSK
jgi:UDP-GlcNAc:undecaprenyl-phosphate GlcNAc-1-phosphate transferase